MRNALVLFVVVFATEVHAAKWLTPKSIFDQLVAFFSG
jgi:hypothetical protein